MLRHHNGSSAAAAHAMFLTVVQNHLPKSLGNRSPHVLRHVKIATSYTVHTGALQRCQQPLSPPKKLLAFDTGIHSCLLLQPHGTARQPFLSERLRRIQSTNKSRLLVLLVLRSFASLSRSWLRRCIIALLRLAVSTSQSIHMISSRAPVSLSAVGLPTPPAAPP